MSYTGSPNHDAAVPAAHGLRMTFCLHKLGISRQALYDLLSGKQPVSPVMAVRLGLLFDQSPASWLNMQTAYDLWHAEREFDKAKVKPLKIAV